MTEYHRHTWSMGPFASIEDAQNRLEDQRDWFDSIYNKSEFNIVSIIHKRDDGWTAYFEAETLDGS